MQGRRVCVYQPEFDECWACGLVSRHDPVSHIMEITFDKVKFISVARVTGMQKSKRCSFSNVYKSYKCMRI